MSRDDVTVLVEPGRAIVGEAGILLTRVLYVKEQPPVAKGTPPRHHGVAGAVERGPDGLAHPRVHDDEAAHGASMSSTYNARPRAAEVMVENGTARVIRARERIEDLWRDESLG